VKNTVYFFIFVVASITTGARAADTASDLAVIVNKSCKLDEVGTADLVKYFTADKTKLPDGTKLTIVMHDPGRAERKAALEGIYRMSENDYNEHFVEATFTGAVAMAPKSLPSAAAVKKFVAETPGAISYVRSEDLDDSVKALKIDGKSPGDSGYRLKVK